MFVTYFDEVKDNPKQGMHHYFVGGICLPLSMIDNIEKQIQSIAVDVFGSLELTPETEFHGKFIYFGKGPFKGMPAEHRVEILTRLASILSENRDHINLIFASIDTKKYRRADADRAAFMFFCERVNINVKNRGHAILIGDYEEQKSKEMIKEFSRFRRSKTDWNFGLRIDAIVDSVHFAKSHHSRLIQLADVYCFCATHDHSGRSGWMAEKLREAINGLDLFPSRYKIWPQRTL